MSRARLGQHFLHDREVLCAVAGALQIAPGDTIIEIGAGHGELTAEVLGYRLKVKGETVRIIAIEKDAKLAEELRGRFREKESFEIIEGDIRKLLPTITSNLKPKTYKLCGNIPYYLTGFLLRLVSELIPLPVRSVFMMQKEVAERICAQPPQMSQLAASVQFWAKPKIVGVVPRSAFAPPPKVDSAIISLEARGDVLDARSSTASYYAAVHALFRQPRKTLLNNIADATGLPKNEVAAVLEKAGVDSATRPHNLSLAQISALAACVTFPNAKNLSEGRKSAAQGEILA